MLEVAIALLFALTGAAALLALVDSAIKARNTFAQLMEERALLQAGFVREIEPGETRLRPARRTMPDRRIMLAKMPRPSSAAA